RRSLCLLRLWRRRPPVDCTWPHGLNCRPGRCDGPRRGRARIALITREIVVVLSVRFRRVETIRNLASQPRSGEYFEGGPEEVAQKKTASYSEAAGSGPVVSPNPILAYRARPPG